MRKTNCLIFLLVIGYPATALGSTFALSAGVSVSPSANCSSGNGVYGCYINSQTGGTGTVSDAITDDPVGQGTQLVGTADAAASASFAVLNPDGSVSNDVLRAKADESFTFFTNGTRGISTEADANLTDVLHVYGYSGYLKLTATLDGNALEGGGQLIFNARDAVTNNPSCQVNLTEAGTTSCTMIVRVDDGTPVILQMSLDALVAISLTVNNAPPGVGVGASGFADFYHTAEISSIQAFDMNMHPVNGAYIVADSGAPYTFSSTTPEPSTWILTGSVLCLALSLVRRSAGRVKLWR